MALFALKKSMLNPAQDRNDAIQWAREVLSDRTSIILDLETTGIDPKAEALQIGIVDATTKRVLLETLLSPYYPISQGAIEQHGILVKDTIVCPKFSKVWPLIDHYCSTCRIIIYNAAYDTRILKQSSAICGNVVPLEIKRYDCAMLKYAAFVGELGKHKRDYKWQKLPPITGVAAHSAISDCLATLSLIERMANAEMAQIADCYVKVAEKPAVSITANKPINFYADVQVAHR